MVGYALQRRASADENIMLAARIVAESVRAANIRVTSSTDIGGSVPVNYEFIFRHGNCWRTSQEFRTPFTI